jgi:hypothetical protein
MFSGIVEAKSKIVEIKNFDQALRIWVAKPPSFDDLKSVIAFARTEFV